MARLVLVLLIVMSVSLSLAGIPVSVMLPLDMIDTNGLTNPTQLQSDLNKLKSGGVDGVMSDVWWGLVERSPGVYNWTSYQQLATLISNAGLKWQVVMSFHKCGGNVGDTCNIPLPSWVLSVGNSNKDIWYRDQEYGYDEEYISLGVDNESLFSGRTPIKIYKDFMSAFKTAFSSYMSSMLTEVQVGLGPCGELRFPSYQLQNDKWSYCGIGEFQCYDKYMLAALSKAASAAGHPEWGYGGPSNAGTYKSYPSQTGFFSSSGYDNYSSDYGRFFLNWYNSVLLTHAETILTDARTIFLGTSAELAAKISGIHWWYADSSHAAELTAGYYNTNGNDAYAKIATLFQKYGVAFDFTCLEMTDASDCGSRPEQLVKQTIYAAKNKGIHYDGENALEICNPKCYQSGFDQIYKEATQYGNINQFTYLRLTRQLVDDSSNWSMFTSFVSRMHSA